MALIEEFESQGNFLFRWRSYVPGVVLLVCLWYLPQVGYWGANYEENLIFHGICLLVSVFGQCIRFYAVGTTPARTSGRNTKEQIAEELNQSGIYSLVRHPLYIGNFLMYLGVVLLMKNFFITVIYIMFFYLYYERIMFAEESFLRRKFGDIYLKWSEITPAFIPKLSGFKPANLSLSWRTGIRREYQGIFGLLVAFVSFDIAILYFNETGRFTKSFWDGLKTIQWIFLGISFACYFVIRILHKLTRLLEVEGRW